METPQTPPEIDARLSKWEFWQRLAAFSFALWSILLAILAFAAETTLSAYADRQEHCAKYLDAINQRLLIVEERQLRVRELLNMAAPRGRVYDYTPGIPPPPP